MSRYGVRFAASVISQMQEASIHLLRGDSQDIMLGQLLGKAMDDMGMVPKKRKARR